MLSPLNVPRIDGPNIHLTVDASQLHSFLANVSINALAEEGWCQHAALHEFLAQLNVELQARHAQFIANFDSQVA
jgi:hypothetical protein